MKNKKGDASITIICIVLIIVILSMGVFMFLNLADAILNGGEELECFEKIAIKYCGSKGYNFYELSPSFTSFECIYEREIVGEFKFTKKERKHCYVWEWLHG